MRPASVSELDVYQAAKLLVDQFGEESPTWPRGAQWVERRLVADVGFSTWTAGKILRHPTIEAEPDLLALPCWRPRPWGNCET